MRSAPGGLLHGFAGVGGFKGGNRRLVACRRSDSLKQVTPKRLAVEQLVFELLGLD